MDNHVCIRYDYFILFVLVSLGIIAWVLYQCYHITLGTKNKLKNIYENIDDLVKNQKEPIVTPPEEPITLPIKEHGPGVYQYPSGPIAPPIVEYRMPFNIATQSVYGSYQLVGYVYPHRHPDQMFRLMGRQIYSNKYEYYVIHPYTDIKIPIKVKNDWELNTGDHVEIPGFHGRYVVQIYDMDHPF